MQVQPRSGPEKAFSQVLREIRAGHGASQEQLALAAAFDRTLPSLLKRAAHIPTLRTLFLLAGLLGVRPSDILLQVELRVAGKGKLRDSAPSP